MKKILVLSDTHSNLAKLEEILPSIKNVDLIFHCGDLETDIGKISALVGAEVISVKGNCDHNREEEYKIIKVFDKKFILTHGDSFGINTSLNRLYFLAKEHNCDCLCFGHTHIPFCEKIDDIIFLNPGSLSKPRDGKNGSIGYIMIDRDEIFSNIVYYDTLKNNLSGNKLENREKTKIKELLNYSDRF